MTVDRACSCKWRKDAIGMANSNDQDRNETQGKRGTVWWLLLTVRIPLEVAAILFDSTLSRHLIAAILVGFFWGQLHLLINLSYSYWLWPSVVIGCCLTGLWDGCEVFTIRPYLGRWLLLSDDDEQAANKSQD